MRNVQQMKKDHEQRMNVTANDEYYYKEPIPLTEDQKLFLLHKEEELKQKYANDIEFQKRWMEKNYGGTEIRDHYNH